MVLWRDVSGIQQIKGFQVYVRVSILGAGEHHADGITHPFELGTLPSCQVTSPRRSRRRHLHPRAIGGKSCRRYRNDPSSDEWGHTMLREGRTTPGQIDRKWSREMVDEFNQWLKQKGSETSHAAS